MSQLIYKVSGRVTIVGILWLLAGCGSSPSDKDVTAAFSAGDPLFGHVYDIANMHRSNGYEKDGSYVVEFSAELKILETPADYLANVATSDQSGVGALRSLALATTGAARWGLVTGAQIAAAKKGDVVPIAGAVALIKSERGWILRPE